ncbi:membrane transport protein-domain-containing protein [Pisolithus orientalis]|uniref:membrane transport protein-domain-containing protein n=1 Tax=Pisolithus orientalis TaxID=936130 RepID=UPI002224FAA6|nr:membrane transport protein-domain-containing protein [Pisolithus orientalis]KAI6000317.1 membrane transport protein-domain-containing protein [Pisolithus orientalis]
MPIVNTPILPLLYTVFQSIFQVFLLCLTGFYLSWKGIADKRIQRALNNINICLFTPALLFSKVAFFLTLEKLRELWVIPIFFLLICGLSGLIANGLAKTCRLKRSQRNFAVAASIFMNSNSLPVALMQSLVATVPGLKWTPEDDQDAMFGRALTYLVVFSTLGMMLRWSYGVWLLSHEDTEEPELIGDVASGHLDRSGTNNKIRVQSPTLDAELRRLSDSSLFHTPSDSDLESDSDERLVIRSPPGPSRLSNTAYTPTSHDNAADVHARRNVVTQRFPSDHTSLSQHLRTLVHRIRTRRICMPSLPPPLFASLFALLFTFPPFQAILKSDSALNSAGACSVPLTLVVLGGWFWEDNGKEGDDAKRGHGSGAGDGRTTERAGHRTRSPGVPRGDDDEGEPEEDGIECELREDHNNIPSQTRHRQVLTSESAECLTARDRAQGQAQHGGDLWDSSNISQSPSSSSLFSVLQDMWKMTPISSGRQRRRGPIRLADDDDERDHEADVEVGDHIIWRMHSSTSLKGQQTVGRVNNPAGRRQPIRPTPPGETTTIVVTLISRMILTPLLVLPLMAFFTIRGEGDGGIKVFDDPVFVIVMVLLIASPPAGPNPKLEVAPATIVLTSVALSQLPGPTPSAGPAPTPSNTSTAVPTASTEVASSEANSSFERLISRTIFWAYCVVTPPVTIGCVMVGMIFMSL